jgi:hypothetical protein
MSKLNKSIFFLSIVIACLLLLELLLGILNYPMVGALLYPMDVKPNSFIGQDPILGYKSVPGYYTAQYQGKRIDITINKNGDRACKKDSLSSFENIDYYFGCSFTFGYGLSDEETFCWKLQTANPCHEIKNFAIGGSGVLYAYLEILNLPPNQLPNRIIYNYASFQNIRSTNSLAWQKQLSAVSNNNHTLYPRALLQDGQLEIVYNQLTSEYKDKGVFKKIRVINLIEDIWAIFREQRFYQSEKVNLVLFEKIQSYCSKNNCEFIVLWIDGDKKTNEMISALQQSNIQVVDVSFDYHKNKYLLKDNFHPNAEANFIFYNKINNALY